MHGLQQEQQHASVVAPVLPIALEQPALSTDPQILCAVAQVCKGWREAVQQCGACNTAVELDFDLLQEQQLHSFVLWLPKHAGLVKSLAVSGWGDPLSGALTGIDYEPIPQSQVDAVQQLLSRALQLAAAPQPVATPQSPASTAATAAASSQLQLARPQQQQQQQLRLASFKTNCLLSSGMVASLPAYSLTYLDLEIGYKRSFDGPAISAALAQLSNLQQLRIASGMLLAFCLFPGSALAGVAHLRKLTSLKLQAEFTRLDEPLQQLLAQPLSLRQLQLDAWEDKGNGLRCLPVLDMARLTKLQELSTRRQLHEETILPRQLQRLEFGGCRTGSNLAVASRCQQLQHISCCVSFRECEPLVWLAALPALQRVALEYHAWQEAADTATAWAQLPLQELKVYPWQDSQTLGVAASQQLVDAVVAGVSACTGLTKLLLNFGAASEIRNDMPDAAASQDSDEWQGVHSEDWLEDGSEVEEEEAVEPHMQDGRAGALQQHGSSSSVVCASLAGLTSLRDLELTCSHNPSLHLGISDALALTALTGLTRLVLAGVGSGDAGGVAAVLQRLQEACRNCDT